VVEILLPGVPPEVKAQVIEWMCDNLNERKRLFASPLTLDYDEICQLRAAPPPRRSPSRSPAPPESQRDSAPRRRERLDGVDEDVRRVAHQGPESGEGRAADLAA